MCVVVCTLCCGVVSSVGGVCGTSHSQHGVSVQARADDAPNWVAEHLGASSRRPRHPFPALMAGEPWPCTCVHGPKKTTRQRACLTCPRDARCGVVWCCVVLCGVVRLDMRKTPSVCAFRVCVQDASVCTGKTPACVEHAGVFRVHTETS